MITCLTRNYQWKKSAKCRSKAQVKFRQRGAISNIITYMGIREAAEEWDCTVPEAREQCRNNKEALGAFKDGGGQFSPCRIPANAPAPINNCTLQKYARELLKKKDNPKQNFVFRDMDIMFSLLVDKGHIILVDSAKALEASSYGFTPDGYNFVFSDAVPKRLFASCFSLVGISYFPMAPSASAVNLNIQ